jgi:diadenosine tetraphosphatase ApaH/serine/threonine PP2A family protein phosphatase
MKASLRDDDLTSGEMIFVHGSPRRPVNEYIFPDDVYNNTHKLQGLFERFDHLCFVGHTHVPGVFVETPDFYTPEELEFVYEIDPKRKALVNVGSVGQPRDRDNRASYVVVEPGAIRFVRVPYDYEATIRKVLPIPEIDDYLGIRLREGR